jgi:hypothetical protein
MRPFWTLTLILAIPTVLVAADEPADRLIPDDVTIHLILLRQKSVQDDLKLAPDVCKKILEFTNTEYEAWQNAVKLSDDERDQKMKEMEKKNEDFLTENLTEGQRKRLHQVVIQVTGLIQLTKPEMVKALDLTEEQQQKFKDLQKSARSELLEILDAKSPEGRSDKLAKLRADIDKKVDAVLTDQQREKVKELVGERFEGQIVLEGP